MNSYLGAEISRALRAAGFLLATCVLAAPAAAAEREVAPVTARAGAGSSSEAGSSSGAEGELRVRLDEDVITGSSERPKVLYILPWRSAQGTPGLDAAPDLKATELFDSLDPDAHERQLRYRQRLAGDAPDATQ